MALADDVVKRFSASRYEHRREPAATEPSGTFDTDCSGFVDYVLNRVDAEALHQVSVDPGHTHALAHNFAELGGSRGLPNGWQAVSTVRELRAGDLVAWTEPLDVNTDDTGHVMVVDQPPVPVPGQPAAFTVTVIDSTASPHGVDDTRRQDTRNQTDVRTDEPSGVGRGTIVLVADDSGRAVAYRWSPTSSKLERPQRLSLLRLT